MNTKVWLIYSLEHRGWWRPGSMGYTNLKSEAGRYTYEEALDIVRDANFHRRDNEPPNEAMVCQEVLKR